MKYTIKTGRHYHSNILMHLWALLNMTNKKKVGYTVMFEENCWYQESMIENSGYNKLFGAGKANHHEDSARIVWNPDYENYGRINLYSYVYENGSWYDKYLTSVSVGQWYSLAISIDEDKNAYLFHYDEDGDFVSHNDPVLRKLLQFYHGGYDTAYHDMTVHFKKLKW